MIIIIIIVLMVKDVLIGLFCISKEAIINLDEKQLNANDIIKMNISYKIVYLKLIIK